MKIRTKIGVALVLVYIVAFTVGVWVGFTFVDPYGVVS